MLGGSSGINAMMYIRGNKKDYDEWASLTNDPIWSGESVLKFFKKQEDYRGNFHSGKTERYLINSFKN